MRARLTETTVLKIPTAPRLFWFGVLLRVSSSTVFPRGRFSLAYLSPHPLKTKAADVPQRKRLSAHCIYRLSRDRGYSGFLNTFSDIRQNVHCSSYRRVALLEEH